MVNVALLVMVLTLDGLFGVGMVCSAMAAAVAIEAERHRAVWWWLGASTVCLGGLLGLAVTIPPGLGNGLGVGGGWR
jgi:hypothetical protein